VDLTVAYKLLEPMAPWVYRHFGPEYAEAIVRPAARSAVPDATGLYAYQDAYGTHRQELNDKIAQRIQVRLKEICDQYKLPGQAIVIQQVMMRKMEPPASLRASIEAKAAQEQASLQMEYTLQKERQEAERKRIEAKGIADFQAIVTQGISDKLLEWKGIEATESLARSPNAKIVIIGSGKNGLPIILGQ
jgi:regulator of protease activity HflC (stomatin/prohibitin superfamily)